MARFLAFVPIDLLNLCNSRTLRPQNGQIPCILAIDLLNLRGFGGAGNQNCLRGPIPVAFSQLMGADISWAQLMAVGTALTHGVGDPTATMMHTTAT